VDNLPVHPRSGDWITSVGRAAGFHMDFGSGTWDGGPIGIPFNLVAGSQVNTYTPTFSYPDESDPGPYPIPADPQREWGSDHHVLIVDTETCRLYEIYDASFGGGQWSGGSGAIWDLRSHALRPAGWTSADAAGLPILHGLVRYDEVASGQISHAIRFTASVTQRAYVWPARHFASGNTDPAVPPMGARFRLKASYDISGFDPLLRTLLQAMKTYGIILADNGSNWYVSGAPDERWDNDLLHRLDVLTGGDFEAVDVSGLMVDPDSGEARTAPEAPAFACTAITALPAVIAAQGAYCLTGHLGTGMTSGAAITITANNVVLDLNGFKVGGQAGGPGTSAIGIYANQRQNITIRNGTVRGFSVGIKLDDAPPYATSQGHVIEGVRLDQNTSAGIDIRGTATMTRNNLVGPTGGGTAAGPDGDAQGILVRGPGARVLGNDVSETSARGAGRALGIALEDAPACVVAGNRVSAVASPDGDSFGILVLASGDTIVSDNLLSGMRYGIYFGSEATGVFMGNLVQGAATPYVGGTAAGATNY
jgi:hypothetical protein